MIGTRGTTLYGLCPACHTWQVDITTPLPDVDSLTAIEDAVLEHARTECVALLRLPGTVYVQALGMLGAAPTPEAVTQ